MIVNFRYVAVSSCCGANYENRRVCVCHFEWIAREMFSTDWIVCHCVCVCVMSVSSIGIMRGCGVAGRQRVICEDKRWNSRWFAQIRFAQLCESSVELREWSYAQTKVSNCPLKPNTCKLAKARCTWDVTKYRYFFSKKKGYQQVKSAGPKDAFESRLSYIKSSLLDNLVVGRPNSTINDNASQ